MKIEDFGFDPETLSKRSRKLSNEIGLEASGIYANWLEKSYEELGEELKNPKMAAVVIAYAMAIHLRITFDAACSSMDMPDYVRDAIHDAAERQVRETTNGT